MRDRAEDHRGRAGDSIVTVRDLKVEFNTPLGVVRALDGVDLDIPRGKIVGVVGESGCGKSVTARAIMRLIQPPGQIVDGSIKFYPGRPEREATLPESSGHRPEPELRWQPESGMVDITAIEPNGTRMRALRGAEIAMIFQEPMSSLNPVFTIGSQIEEAILLHQTSDKGDAHHRAITMLRQVGMPGPERIASSYPHELSGGMRQRAMIAMALSCRPSLLIADEPTTALDVTTEAQILALLRDLQGQIGMSIMFITHSLGVVAQLCDEVIVMYLGEVVERAPVDDIFYAPKHPYTKALLASMPRLGVGQGRRLQEIRGSIPDPYSRISGCSFHPRCAAAMPGICDRTAPTTITLAGGSEVTCHLYPERPDDVRIPEEIGAADE